MFPALKGRFLTTRPPGKSLASLSLSLFKTFFNPDDLGVRLGLGALTTIGYTNPTKIWCCCRTMRRGKWATAMAVAILCTRTSRTLTSMAQPTGPG